MIGQTISHYKILEKIGEAGMGVVYKAQDSRLDRLVALKFLPEQLVSDSSAKARFMYEAKGASAINHPNIATVYDIGEADGKSFIAMEYLEGKTVKELVKENLKLDRVLEVGIQITEGLAAAHKKEIIHRDIKSDNIMLTKDNLAKIIDFGLAKLKGTSKLTESGATVGTIAYMSPEQTRGEEIDHRSDIFSLGVVLYELITGKLPFQGEHNAAIIYSICYEEPEPLARYKSGIPENLQRILDKTLKKDKNIRYQSASDLLADLRGVQKEIAGAHFIAAPKKNTLPRVSMLVGLAVLLVIAGYFIFFRPPNTAEKKPMLAVLPFRNLGPPDQEYFADGITDEITTSLAKISGLGVISNTSAIQYKQTKKNIREIGKELGVDYLLEGSIGWDKSTTPLRVRINPQLIRIKDDTHLWAETYDRVFNQIFEIQTVIAEKVSRAIDITLLEPEHRFLIRKPTENIEAYDYYLQGKKHLEMAHGSFRAADMFLRAVKLDPNFALAYAMFSKACSDEARFSSSSAWKRKIGDSLILMTREEWIEKSREAAEKALGLEPDLPEAHFALGYYFYKRYSDYDKALKQFAIVQKSQPNNSDLFAAIGEIQRGQKNWEKALTNLKKSSDLDPLSSRKALKVGEIYYVLRKYPEAEQYLDRATSLDSYNSDAYSLKAGLYLRWQGNTSKARNILLESLRHNCSNIAVQGLIECDILDGDFQEAVKKMEQLRKGYPCPNGVTVWEVFAPFDMALMYRLTNQSIPMKAYYDSARFYFEKAISIGSEGVRLYSHLGIAYAGLGQKEKAVEEKKKAEELLHASKSNIPCSERLALLYVMLGENEAAIDQLKCLLSIPGHLSIPYLRIDPTWAPLRDHPRFKKLIAGK